ncbi:MAG: tetratricopeptide repeat protein, partial [Planctomycetes bacterium]|nr:tetratricopeptide repeat protein [Planctomycetota bacterium]
MTPASAATAFQQALNAWKQRNPHAVKQACEQTLRLSPRHAKAAALLGVAHLELRELDAAVAALSKAATLDGSDADIPYNLGAALMYQGRAKEAEPSIRRAAALRPNWANAHELLGRCLKMQHRLDEAVGAFEKALNADPALVSAQFGHAISILDQGRPEEAAAAYRRIFALAPNERRTLPTLLFSINSTDNDPAWVKRKHAEFGQYVESINPALPDWNGNADPERPLLIGFVSPDFREHSCAYFMRPLFAGLLRAGHRIACYATQGAKDAVTAEFEAMSAVFRNISGLDSLPAATQVRSDGVDVLVDLAAHTGGSRLDVFARRPAPVQMTYLGYPNTTGLRSIDYRLVDWTSDPEENSWHCVERLLRVPQGRCVWCYRPSEAAPEVGPPPCLTSGHFTFGSFNNNSKITEKVVRAWSAVLRRVPGSRLLLKNKWLHDAGTAERRFRQFEAEGIVRERIEIAPFAPSTREHLGLYSKVDLQLDTFPYNGTTTTCESLWQGVPVVTFAGKVHAARVGASLMKAAGLDGFVGENEPSFIDLAASWADRREELANLRSSMRDRLRSSVLMDEPGFGASVADLVRGAWREFAREHARVSALPPTERLQETIVAGRAALEERDGATAQRAIQRAFALAPESAEANLLAGEALAAAGQGQQAEGYFHKVLAIEPKNAEALFRLGVALMQAGRTGEARAFLSRAAEARPVWADPLAALSRNAHAERKLDEAIAHAERAVGADASSRRAFLQLGGCLMDAGRIDESIDALRRGADLPGLDPLAASHLLLALNYRDDDPVRVRNEHRDRMTTLAAEVARHAAPPAPFDNARDPDKRLTVAIVSADFCNHVCSRFMEPLIHALDRKKFRVHCYADVPRPDNVTERIKSRADAWRDIRGLSGQQVAEMARADGADILIDAAGHSGSNRLDVFAHRAAPVQCTWLGYPNTTGLPEMDWRIVDPASDPDGAEAHCTERLLRVEPCAWCYRPAPDMPEPATAPAARNRFVTFGSYNNLAKVTPAV